MNPDVILCECFARDGLQHEEQILPAAAKVDLVNRFTAVGFRRIEVTSYAHPKYIPQFADTDEVLSGIQRAEGVGYKATCVNTRSVERALAAKAAGYGPTEISVILSATESHTQRNLRKTRQQQWANIESMIQEASGEFTIVASISVALGCPFEGPVDAESVIQDVRRLARLGVKFVSLADTTGMGNPRSVSSLFRHFLGELPEVTAIAHFHDTRGIGIANCLAAYEVGLRYFDASIGGVGGHPTKIQYGDGYTGNVCTEDLAVMFEGMGVHTGLDLDLLLETSRYCESVLGRPLRGMVTRSGLGLVRWPDSSPVIGGTAS